MQDALFIAWCLNPNGWCIHLECSNERTVACSVSYQCQVLISRQLLEEKKAANIYIKKEKKRWCFLSATHFGGWYVSDCCFLSSLFIVIKFEIKCAFYQKTVQFYKKRYSVCLFKLMFLCGLFFFYPWQNILNFSYLEKNIPT